MIQAVITGGVLLPLKQLSQDQIQEIQQKLTFENPFEEGKFTYGFRRSQNYLVVPKGFLPELKEILGTISVTEKTTNSPVSFTLKDNFQLRPYQQEAEQKMVEVLKDNHSVLLTAPTSAGKSFSLTSVIQKLKQKTLILAHLSMLIKQMKAEMEQNSNAKVLELTSKTTLDEILNADIILSTFSLLNYNKDLNKTLAEHIGTLVVDETENMISDTRISVLFYLRPKYSIFMSATPSKELMQQTPLLFYFIGNQKINMKVSEEYIITPEVVMLDYRHLRWQSPDDKNRYKSSLWVFYKREKIPNDLAKLAKVWYDTKQGCQWVIIDLTKAQDYMKNLLSAEGIPEEAIAIIRGTTSAKQREKILNQIKEGTVRALIGSKPLSAGVSIGNLSIAYRLMPHSSSDELLIQQIGRLKRYADFKQRQKPVWCDLAISGSLEYGGKRRFAYYKKHYDVRLINLKELIDA